MNLLRINQICQKLSVSRATLHRIMKSDSSFPRPIPITKNLSAFSDEEVENWIKMRAQKND